MLDINSLHSAHAEEGLTEGQNVEDSAPMPINLHEIYRNYRVLKTFDAEDHHEGTEVVRSQDKLVKHLNHCTCMSLWVYVVSPISGAVEQEEPLLLQIHQQGSSPPTAHRHYVVFKEQPKGIIYACCSDRQ